MIDSNNKLKSLSKSLIESAKTIMSEKKTNKDLAKLAPPHDKVTHADVLVGRGVYTHDDVKAHKAKKGIKEDADMVVVNAPVLSDIDGELAEVLKRDPRDKTVHVQLEGMKYILKAGQYKELDEAVKNPYAVGMAAAMKATGDKPPLKKSTITKAHESAKKVAEEVEEDLEEDYVSHAQRKAVWAARADGGKGHPDNKKKKMKEEVEELDELSKNTLRKYERTTQYGGTHKNVKGNQIARAKLYGSADGYRARVLAREEAEQIDELSTATLQSYRKKARAQGNAIVDKMKLGGGDWSKDQKDTKTLRKRAAGAQASGKQLVKRGESLKTEEVEQIDELSKQTMKMYHAKASQDRDEAKKDKEWADYRFDPAEKAQASDTIRKRSAGIKMVRKKLKTEEAEQIDELSKATLGSYGRKALRAGLGGDEKRMKGANLASAKMYPDQYKKSPLKAKVAANEEVEDLDEKRGLWDNIHAKRERIKAGSGERMRKPGSKGAPTDADFKAAQNEEWEVKRGTKVLSTHKNKDDADVKAMKHPLNKVVAKEEVELTQEEIENIEAILADLDEGRGRPPKEGSAAWHAKQKQNLDDMPALSVQLRKAASIDKPVTFMNGESKKILPGHINKFNDHLDARKTSQDKAAFQKRAHKSHDEFVKAVSEPVPGRSKDTGEIVKYK